MKEGQRGLWSLFLSMLKTGALTFGGGVTMLPVLRHEFVERRGLLTDDEFLDLIAIAESTPGPIAVNAATFVGYRAGGTFGSLVATLGIVLPSFVIIFLVSLFYDAFRASSLVAGAFLGVRAAVVYLILSAAVRMFRGMKKSPMSLVIFGAVLLLSLSSLLFAFSPPTTALILLGALVGLAVYLIGRKRGGEK